jgi:hypothetical protein
MNAHSARCVAQARAARNGFAAIAVVVVLRAAPAIAEGAGQPNCRDGD